MAKVRTKKEHKKRIAKRNNILEQEKKKFQKAQKDFLMKLIEEEKQKGMFDNPTQPPKLNIPNLGLPTIGGPSLGIQEGPKL